MPKKYSTFVKLGRLQCLILFLTLGNQENIYYSFFNKIL